MLHRSRGSMLITAIFLIVVFTALLAVMIRMISDTRQANVSSVYAIKAENLAQGAVDTTLALLFEKGKESALLSSIWLKYEPVKKLPQNKKSYVVIDCNSSEQKGKAPFCDDRRCVVEKATITPYGTGELSDTSVVYDIKAETVCNVPWVDDDSSSTANAEYKVRRVVHIQASDVRWYNVDSITGNGN